MNALFSRAAIAALATGVLVLAVAGPSHAATTFGSTLADAANDRFCGGGSAGTYNCTGSQATLNPTRTASGGLTAPTGGVVVRWRIKVGSPTFLSCWCTTLGLTGKLRVLRANFGAGTGSPESMPLPTVTDKIFEFPARLKIIAGDRIGVDLTVVANPQGFAPVAYTQGGGVGTRDYWTPPAADGANTAPNTSGEDNKELLINADVEPDIDNDGYGDETQDGCLTIQGPCPPAAPSGPDKTAPGLTLGGSTKQKLGSSVNVDVTCSEACSVEGSGTVSTSKPKAGKALTLKRATLALGANKSGKLKLKLSKKSRGKIKRTLRRHGKARATVKITGKDAAGNVASATRKIKLRR